MRRAGNTPRCSEAGASLAEGPVNVVFAIGDLEEVQCSRCLSLECFDFYRKGEAFLAGPAHSPMDGNAHHICRKHLDADAVISES